MQHEAFFSMAATVIPVLLIALFIQERFQPDRRGPALLRLAVLPLLLFGELTAASALLQQKPTALEQDIALVAISAGSWMLISRPFYELLVSVTKRADLVFSGLLVAMLILSVAFGQDAMPILGLALAAILWVAGYALHMKDLLTEARAERDGPAERTRSNSVADATPPSPAQSPSE